MNRLPHYSGSGPGLCIEEMSMDLIYKSAPRCTSVKSRILEKINLS